MVLLPDAVLLSVHFVFLIFRTLYMRVCAYRANLGVGRKEKVFITYVYRTYLQRAWLCCL